MMILNAKELESVSGAAACICLNINKGGSGHAHSKTYNFPTARECYEQCCGDIKYAKYNGNPKSWHANINLRRYLYDGEMFHCGHEFQPIVNKFYTSEQSCSSPPRVY